MQCSAVEEKLMKKFRENLLSEKDYEFLKLIFSKEPTQRDLDEFLKGYDIEEAASSKSLMLSYFMKMHPELKFTDYETPRLKGLFNFFRFGNLNLIAHFSKIGKLLNKNNIPILIIKGLAMKYLRPELSRAMSDTDILIPETDYLKAIKLVRSLGYRLDIYVHSADAHEPDSDAGIIDIHRFIFMYSLKERKLNKYFFKRAKQTVYQGVKILVPCNEDLLFILLTNLSVNLRNNTSKSSVLYSFFDAKFLLEKENFDWNIIIKNAKISGTLVQTAFAMKFINSVIPDLIPNKIMSDEAFDKSVNNYCSILIYNNKFLPAMKKISRRVKIKSIFKDFNSFVRYITLKPQYCFMKSNFVTKSPFWTKLILSQRRKRCA